MATTRFDVGAGMVGKVETLEHIAELMLSEDRPAWARLVIEASEALAGKRHARRALVESLELVAETMLLRERPVWARLVLAAATELHTRRVASRRPC
jgi:hypothetical protein